MTVMRMGLDKEESDEAKKNQPKTDVEIDTVGWY
jgi:hypothetical protein